MGHHVTACLTPCSDLFGLCSQLPFSSQSPPLVGVPQTLDADWDDPWDKFDERKYLNAKKWRVGDDPYKLYAFNQRESERISSNRAVPDTRDKRYLLLSSSQHPLPIQTTSSLGVQAVLCA